MSIAGFMSDPDAGDQLNSVVQRFFSDDKRVRYLSEGEILTEQGAVNRRLYLVRVGRVVGTRTRANGTLIEDLQAGPGEMVGVRSFFLRPHRATRTLVATEDTVVAYLERGGDDGAVTRGKMV